MFPFPSIDDFSPTFTYTLSMNVFFKKKNGMMTTTDLMNIISSSELLGCGIVNIILYYAALCRYRLQEYILTYFSTAFPLTAIINGEEKNISFQCKIKFSFQFVYTYVWVSTLQTSTTKTMFLWKFPVFFASVIWNQYWESEWDREMKRT